MVLVGALRVVRYEIGRFSKRRSSTYSGGRRRGRVFFLNRLNLILIDFIIVGRYGVVH